jgi:hypothetical protein
MIAMGGASYISMTESLSLQCDLQFSPAVAHVDASIQPLSRALQVLQQGVQAC